MSKVKVFIEETLCKEVIIDVPDELDSCDQMDYAEDKAEEMVNNGEIVLTADDFTGVRMCMIQLENGEESSWIEMR